MNNLENNLELEHLEDNTDQPPKKINNNNIYNSKDKKIMSCQCPHVESIYK
jgi:hypothetical protein